MWHKIKNKKTLVLYLTNFLKTEVFEELQVLFEKNKIVLKTHIFNIKRELF
jgi:hypothetical protein